MVPAAEVPPALQSDALVASGLRERPSDEITDGRQVLVYDDEDAVDTDAVREESATGE